MGSSVRVDIGFYLGLGEEPKSIKSANPSLQIMGLNSQDWRIQVISHFFGRAVSK